MPNTITLALPLLAVLSLALAPSAQARLGGDEASIYTDAQTLGTLVTRSDGAGYIRFHLALAHGSVDEYTGTTGQVFAIRFGGGPMPPLDLLLGSYINDYAAASAPIAGDRRSVRIQNKVLGASVHGRPYAINGVIWLPALLPSGIEPGGLP